MPLNVVDILKTFSPFFIQSIPSAHNIVMLMIAKLVGTFTHSWMQLKALLTIVP
jgi:hypothetical protein